MNKLATRACTGCGACKNICPVNAIQMKSNEMGFIYPEIISDNCIECGKCQGVCPINIPYHSKNSEEKIVYAMQSRDEALRLRSTSGGAFSELAQMILAKGGVVVGAAYRDDWSVEHCMVQQEAELEKLRRSKYQQSDMGVVFRQILDKLNAGSEVLFCGTPCQNAGLRAYLGKKHDNLYLCDFICRGVPSPGLFQSYLKDLERQYDSKVVSVWMKNKRYGWHGLTTVINFENGQEYVKKGFEDTYVRLFLKYNVGIRPSCFQCRFKDENSVADLTLGDFWGLEGTELDDNLGTSVIICRTQKGRHLMETIEKQIKSCIMSLDDVKRGNPCLSSSIPSGMIDSASFFDKMNQQGYQHAMRWIEGHRKADHG